MKKYIIVLICCLALQIVSFSANSQILDSEESAELLVRTNELQKIVEIIPTLEIIDLKEYVVLVIEPTIVDVRLFLTKLTIKYGVQILNTVCKNIVELVDEIRKLLITHISDLSADFILFFYKLSDETLCINYTKKKLIDFKNINS